MNNLSNNKNGKSSTKNSYDWFGDAFVVVFFVVMIGLGVVIAWEWLSDSRLVCTKK